MAVSGERVKGCVPQRLPRPLCSPSTGPGQAQTCVVTRVTNLQPPLLTFGLIRPCSWAGKFGKHCGQPHRKPRPPAAPGDTCWIVFNPVFLKLTCPGALSNGKVIESVFGGTHFGKQPLQHGFSWNLFSSTPRPRERLPHHSRFSSSPPHSRRFFPAILHPSPCLGTSLAPHFHLSPCRFPK